MVTIIHDHRASGRSRDPAGQSNCKDTAGKPESAGVTPALPAMPTEEFASSICNSPVPPATVPRPGRP